MKYASLQKGKKGRLPCFAIGREVKQRGLKIIPLQHNTVYTHARTKSKYILED